MIQRIQSLYLLLSSVITSIFIYYPVASLTMPDNTVSQLFSYGIKNFGNHTNEIDFNPVLIIILAVISAMLGIFTIFLYKRRKHQIWLCILNILILLAILSLIVYYCSYISVNYNAKVNYFITSIFPFISIIILYLSIKRIHKDEKLIRSVDRIR